MYDQKWAYVMKTSGNNSNNMYWTHWVHYGVVVDHMQPPCNPLKYHTPDNKGFHCKFPQQVEGNTCTTTCTTKNTLFQQLRVSAPHQLYFTSKY
mgnify:CR=1 FL=1